MPAITIDPVKDNVPLAADGQAGVFPTVRRALAKLMDVGGGETQTVIITGGTNSYRMAVANVLASAYCTANKPKGDFTEATRTTLLHSFKHSVYNDHVEIEFKNTDTEAFGRTLPVYQMEKVLKELHEEVLHLNKPSHAFPTAQSKNPPGDFSVIRYADIPKAIVARNLYAELVAAEGIDPEDALIPAFRGIGEVPLPAVLINKEVFSKILEHEAMPNRGRNLS